MSIHVPIGFTTVSGNPCPQDGIYISKHNNRRYICRRGKAMPKPLNEDSLLELESYLC